MSIKSVFERLTGHDPRVYDDRIQDGPAGEETPDPAAVTPQPQAAASPSGGTADAKK